MEETCDTLFQMSQSKRSGKDFMTEHENLQENMKLEEMSILFKRDSGLPVNLWLDDSGTWKKAGHWKRIKFQSTHGNKTISREMIPMSINDDPQILVNNPKMELSQSEINLIRQFVIDNKDLLNKLSDQEISIFDFKEKIKLSG